MDDYIEMRIVGEKTSKMIKNNEIITLTYELPFESFYECDIEKSDQLNIYKYFLYRRMELKLLSFNIYQFRLIDYNQDHIAKFQQLIEKADIICLQESNQKLKKYLPKNYEIAIECYSSGISNAIVIKNDIKIESLSQILLTTPEMLPERNAIFIKINDVLIANTHLTGGRYDDFAIINSHTNLNIREKQITEILTHMKNEKKHIICGDFNASYQKTDISAYLKSIRISYSKEVENYMTIGQYFKNYRATNTEFATGPYNSFCDYVFTNMSIKNNEIYDYEISDHKAILTTIFT